MANGVITFLKRLVAPGAPGAGKARIYVDDSGAIPKAKLQDDDGQIYGFESVYGANSQFATDRFVDTNSLATYKTYTSIVYPAGLATAGFKYEIQFSAITKNSVNTRNMFTRIALDGVTLEEEISIEHKDSGADIRIPVGDLYVVDGTDLNNVGGFIDVDYRPQSDGDTSTMYRATVTFKRIA